MHAFPHSVTQHEPTKKQLWIAAFTSLLCRLSPDDAAKEADRAMDICDERWRSPEWVWTWQYKHNYPVGAVYRSNPALPPTNTRPIDQEV